MARRKVSVDEITTALKAALDEYAIEVSKDLNEVAQELGKKAQAALRQTSPRKTGEYAKSWKIDVQAGRLATIVTVYSSKPGLPHLLENGHALPQGGRATAYPHIAPVAEAIEDKFIQELEARI
ncbi:MAG: HK97 gp10 family phage protein [Oscillospiraceae bacterium]|nr:HK97 gp10 family phage protein [Oscillospiraceae bacterium]